MNDGLTTEQALQLLLRWISAAMQSIRITVERLHCVTNENLYSPEMVAIKKEKKRNENLTKLTKNT